MDPAASRQDFLHLSTRCKPLVELPPEVVQLVFERCRERSFETGSVMIRQGDRGDCLMVLLDGRASVTTLEESGTRRAIASLGPFEVAGEMALVTDQTRSVSAWGTAELSRRPEPDDLRPHPQLPDDTRLWAALQKASGGTWGGCVFDVDQIIETLDAGTAARNGV